MNRPSGQMPAPRPTGQIPVITAEQLEELPFGPGPIQELLRLFVKAIRAHQMYLPNNPVHQGATDAVRAAFPPVWKHTEEFVLSFTETEIKWLGAPVHAEPTKAADSLPWVFFKDGVREITISSGFETEELDQLLGILHRVRNAAPEEDDLLTMLWEADFANLRYRYVDIGSEPAGPLGAEPHDQEPASPDAVRAAVRQSGPTSLAGVVSMQDFDATLYFLDDKELDYLRKEIEREYSMNLRQNVIALLLDIFEAQQAPLIRGEVTDIIETQLLQMLASGELHGVAYLLAEVQAAVNRAPEVTPDQRVRLGQLPDRMSTAEPLGQFLQALDESSDLPPRESLAEMVGQLRSSALGTILSWLPRFRNAEVRPLVEAAAERLAAANPGELSKLILSKEAPVALEAMRRSGHMKATGSVPSMARVLGDGNVQLRQAAVAALTEIGTPGAMQALDRSIEDADRDVRIAAVRTLGQKAYRGVFGKLEAAVKGKKLAGADLTERMAFFEAYGAMCGEAGIPFLDELLNSKTLFGSKKEDPEVRACAAMALGRVGGKKAIESLQKSADEKDIVVRNAINRAMRGGKS